ncbi:MAG: EF-Tu/IF-2/RF-3 family GTPase, partial [Chitinophagales bacterium]
DEFHDYRGYAGRVAGGVLKPGDEIMVLPSGFTSSITSIDTFDGPVKEAYAPMSVTVRIDDDIDISRGDMIIRPNNVPKVGQDIDLMICWLGRQKLAQRGKYALKHTTADVRCVIKNIRYKLNINNLHRMEEAKDIGMNDIARIQVRTTKPLFYDTYRRNRITGSVILIDEGTNETVAAGMII